MTTETTHIPSSVTDWLTLQQAHATIYYRLDHELTTGPGLSLPQVHTLIYLRAEGPCAQVRVVSELRRQAQTMTQVLDRLERRGFAKRGRHPTDRRANLVWITPAGEEALAEALPIMGAVLRSTLGHLDRDERTLLRKLAGRLDGGTGRK